MTTPETDLYHGYYGKTLRIVTSNDEQLVAIIEALQLMLELRTSFSLSKLFDSSDELSNRIDATCCVNPKFKVFVRENKIIWQDCESGWRDAIDKITVLLGCSGHQYFEGSEIIVELSHCE